MGVLSFSCVNSYIEFGQKEKKETFRKNAIRPAINILQLGLEMKENIEKLEVGSEWEGRVRVINLNRLKSWWRMMLH